MNSISDSTEDLFAELDYRESDGIEVSLLWNRNSNSLSVFLCDTRTDEVLEIPVSAGRAGDAFRHPFAYAAARCISTGAEPLAHM